MGFILGFLAVVVIATLGFVFVKGVEQDNNYDHWATQCVQDGGVAQDVSTGFFSKDTECFKNGKIIDHTN